MTLSIGQAWDETKQILQADGRSILAVALALAVLPGAILETVAPSNLRPAETSILLSLLGFVTAVLAVTSQLAVSRIALGPSTTVRDALALAFRRMPMLFGALVLVILPFALLVGVFSMRLQGNLTAATIPPVVAIPVTLLALGAIYVLLRLMFLTPLAADTRLSPFGLVKQAWRLSSGRSGKLFLLVLILTLVAVLLIGALGGALSAVIILALGEIAPGNLSAVLVALIQQLFATAVSLLFVIVVSRLYVQAKGGRTEVSVPHAGSE